MLHLIPGNATSHGTAVSSGTVTSCGCVSWNVTSISTQVHVYVGRKLVFIVIKQYLNKLILRLLFDIISIGNRTSLSAI